MTREKMFSKYKIKTLKNGLRVVAIPMNSTESVTVFVIIGAGTRFEDRQNNGISHFLEHIAFKGTKKFKTALALSSTVDSVGAEFNAFTDKESTGFYVKAAKKHLGLALEVLSELVFHPLIKEVDINKEKGVIVEEINMYNDQPMSKVGNDFETLLYSNTPLGMETVGTKKNILKMSQKDFLLYRKSYYVPERMILGIAGAMPKATSLVRKYFNPARTVPGDPVGSVLGVHQGRTLLSFSQSQPALFVRNKETAQSHFCLGVRAFKRMHRDRYALGILSAILGGGMSSRLFTEVREKRGLAYYVSTSVGTYCDNGYLVTQAGTDINKIGKAIGVILKEYHKVQGLRFKVISKELQKAKEYLKGRFILSLENSKAVASLFAENLLLEGKIRLPKEILKKVDGVTLADVRRVAKKIFVDEGLNLSVVGPYKDKTRFEKLLKF